jgi:membrane fusion protein, multidrug efflux system
MSFAMTFETKDRHGQSVPELSHPHSPRFASSDLARNRPIGDARVDAAEVQAPASQKPVLSGPKVEALAPEHEERHIADADEERHDKARKGLLRRHRLACVGGLILLLVALPTGYLYWDYASHFESTDDAFIAARQFTIAPKVPGYITAVLVTDNEHVVTGQVIARIDQRDYHNALAEAEAQVAAARASIDTIDAQTGVQQAQIRANVAQLRRARAALVFARQQAARYRELAATAIAGTIQDAQRYTSQLNEQEAALHQARATVSLARQQIAALQAERDSAVANLDLRKAQRDQAQLNLSYTIVTADQPGRLVQLSAAVGEFAQPGTNLSMFVPDDIWVWANFKETQLDYMRPGQPVTLEIDAYPERTIHGHVASVQPGSGTAFSLLPAENATGNYVKIVQRVPVKLVMDDWPADVALGPGMSVDPTVRVDPAPSLYERLEAWL